MNQINNLINKIKTAINIIDSISPDVFYPALAIYEWSSLNKDINISEEMATKLIDFIDGVDTIYDEYVREECINIINNSIAKSVQKKNESYYEIDDFPIEEEIWVKDAEGNIIDKLNEKDDFLFFHQFDNQEIIDELLDRHGEEITITRIHFNDDNLPEESETIYDFNEADKPELDASNMDDDISADDMHRISAMAIEESKKLKKMSAEKQNDMTVEDYSEMTPEQDEIVDYVSPNAVDANMRPVEVDLNKI